MKVKNYLILFYLFQVNNSFCQLYIEGKVTGERLSTITIFTPINSFFNLNNEVSSVTINLNETNEFKTNIFSKNSNPEIITVRIADKNLYLAFESGDSIYLDLNFNNENWYNITGSNAIGHTLLNKYLAEPILSFGSIYNYFDNNKMKNIDPIEFFKKNLGMQAFFIDSLFNMGEISDGFYFLAKKSICYSQSNEFLKPFLRPSKLHSFYDDKTINSFIDSIFSIENPKDTLVLNAFAGRLYVSSFYNNLEKKIKGYQDIFDIKDTVFNDLDGQNQVVSSSYTPYMNIENPNVKEYLWGILFHNLENMFPEATKETDIMAFQKYFPNSIFKIQMENSKFRLAHKNVTIQQNTAILIDTITKFKTLYDVHCKYFKDQLVFIDLWATWCIPCKNEFKYNKTIDSFFYSKNIKRLYISFDEKEYTKSWVANINNYKLEGINIIANTQLKMSILQEIFNDKNSYSIPRYVLMDKKGKVILKNTYRPSDKENLFKQIEKWIK